MALRADAARNRERILNAAAHVFAERGLEAGLDEIARHAGVGTGTVYRRFPDKTTLIEALVDDRFDEVESLLREALADEHSWHGFARYMEGVVGMQVRDRALKELLFTDEHAGRKVAANRARVRPLLERLVRRTRKDGHLRADVGVTDVMMAGFMAASAGAFTAGAGPETWRRYLAIALAGLRADAPGTLPGKPLSRPVLESCIASGHAAR